MELMLEKKFNFFKKDKTSTKNAVKSFANRILKIISYFIFYPAITYMLTQKIPQLQTSLPQLLESVPAHQFLSIVFIIYPIMLAKDTCIKFFQDALKTEQLGKKFNNIWEPFVIIAEVCFILTCLTPIWSFIWPIIR